jgi:hypothetical protein
MWLQRLRPLYIFGYALHRACEDSTSREQRRWLASLATRSRSRFVIEFWDNASSSET